MSRRKRLQSIVDLLLIARADLAIVHDLAVSIPCDLSGHKARSANGQKVRTKTSNEPFQEDLKHGCSDQRVKQADYGVVHVPKRLDADLHEEENDDRDEHGQQSC
jgi:hypothetical protein